MDPIIEAVGEGAPRPRSLKQMNRQRQTSGVPSLYQAAGYEAAGYSDLVQMLHEDFSESLDETTVSRELKSWAMLS